LLDGSSRTSAVEEVVVSADGKASNGGAVAFKTTSKRNRYMVCIFIFGGGKYCVAVRDKGMCLWAEANECRCGSSVINYSLEAIPISYQKVVAHGLDIVKCQNSHTLLCCMRYTFCSTIRWGP
ncbi:hypothetical protein Tco_0048756, partial [Tanacetum coccineum]